MKAGTEQGEGTQQTESPAQPGELKRCLWNLDAFVQCGHNYWGGPIIRFQLYAFICELY